MSSYGTKKPGGSLAVQMTFPTVFQNTYSHIGETPRFATQMPHRAPNVSIGTDVQSIWHEQKRADAHRMSRAKVYSTILMNNRSQVAVHNMPFQPKPVLGQRKFANPSHGAMGGGNARQDLDSAPFHYANAITGGHMYPEDEHRYEGGLVGGVLRTAQGQSYGRNLLQARIAQLDAITQAKSQFDSEGILQTESAPFAGATSAHTTDVVGSVELGGLLQQINDALNQNFFGNAEHAGIDNRGTDDSGARNLYQDSYKAFSKIVEIAITGSAGEIDDVLEYIKGTSADDGIITKLEAIVDRETAPDENLRVKNIMISLREFWLRISKYLEKMTKLAGEPYQNRKNASNALIKSYRFSKLRDSTAPADFINASDAQDAQNNRSEQFPSSFNTSGDDGDSGNGSAGQFGHFNSYPRSQPSTVNTGSTYYQRQAEQSSQPPGHRDTRAFRRREDSQHGYLGDGRARFSEDERNTFAYNSGEFQTQGRPVGWADDEEGEGAQYGEATVREANEGSEGDEGEGEEEEKEEEESEGAPSPGGGLSRLQSRRNEHGDWDVTPAQEVQPTRLFSARASLPSAVAPPSASPPEPFTKRADLPRTIEGLKQLAQKVNEHYKTPGGKTVLPDGKGAIWVYGGTVKSARANFIKRLNL